MTKSQKKHPDLDLAKLPGTRIRRHLESGVYGGYDARRGPLNPEDSTGSGLRTRWGMGDGGSLACRTQKPYTTIDYSCAPASSIAPAVTGLSPACCFAP